MALVEEGGDNADYPRIDMTHLSFPQAVFSGFFICALLYMAFNSFRVNLYSPPSFFFLIRFCALSPHLSSRCLMVPAPVIPSVTWPQWSCG